MLEGFMGSLGSVDGAFYRGGSVEVFDAALAGRIPMERTRPRFSPGIRA